MNKELIEKLRLMAFESVDNDEATMLHEAADALEAKAAPVGELREAFEEWLGITPCGAAHDLAVKAFQAGAAYQRQSGVVMPERMTPHFNDNHYAAAWNACLDEFARLNGAGSHE